MMDHISTQTPLDDQIGVGLPWSEHDTSFHQILDDYNCVGADDDDNNLGGYDQDDVEDDHGGGGQYLLGPHHLHNDPIDQTFHHLSSTQTHPKSVDQTVRPNYCPHAWSFLKYFFWFCVLAAITMTLFMYFRKIQTLVRLFMKYRISGFFILFISFMFQALLCLPTLPLVLAGGYTYGVTHGFVIITICSLSTSVVAFLLSRYICRDFFRKKLGIDDIVPDSTPKNRPTRTHKRNNDVNLPQTLSNSHPKASCRLNTHPPKHRNLATTSVLSVPTTTMMATNPSRTPCDFEGPSLSLKSLNTGLESDNDVLHCYNLPQSHRQSPPSCSPEPVSTQSQQGSPSSFPNEIIRLQSGSDLNEDDFVDPFIPSQQHQHSLHDNQDHDHVMVKVQKTAQLHTTDLVMEDEPNFWTKIDQVIAEDGFTLTFLLRFSPLHPYGIFNYMFGVTSVNFLPYFLGSSVALIPTILLEVYMGSALKNVGEIVHFSKNSRSIVAPGQYDSDSDSLLPILPTFPFDDNNTNNTHNNNNDSVAAGSRVYPSPTNNSIGFGSTPNFGSGTDGIDPNNISNHIHNNEIPENEHALMKHERQNVVFWCGLIFTLLSAIFLSLYVKTKLNQKLDSLQAKKKEQQQQQYNHHCNRHRCSKVKSHPIGIIQTPRKRSGSSVVILTRAPQTHINRIHQMNSSTTSSTSTNPSNTPNRDNNNIDNSNDTNTSPLVTSNDTAIEIPDNLDQYTIQTPKRIYFVRRSKKSRR